VKVANEVIFDRDGLGESDLRNPGSDVSQTDIDMHKTPGKPIPVLRGRANSGDSETNQAKFITQRVKHTYHTYKPC
jgi:hypothetical protein